MITYKRLPPVNRIGIAHRPAEATDAGIVYQHIRCAELALHLVEEHSNRVCIGDIGGHAEHLDVAVDLPTSVSVSASLSAWRPTSTSALGFALAKDKAKPYYSPPVTLVVSFFLMKALDADAMNGQGDGDKGAKLWKAGRLCGCAGHRRKMFH